MGKTNIEWADFTFNPFIGCTKVSPGCLNCYADTQDQRRGWTPEGWGKGKPRQRTSEATWRLPIKWNKTGFMICPDCRNDLPAKLQRGSGIPLVAEMCGCGSKTAPTESRRPRVFCSSLADFLDEEVPIEWFIDLMGLVHLTQNLDWLLLTKRPHLWEPRLEEALRKLDPACDLTDWVAAWLNGKAPSNVWIGTSAEDQQRADERIPKLLEIPAVIRFLSAEPLLGPVNLKVPCFNGADSFGRMPGIDWVIAGSESGPLRRTMEIGWIESLRDQCSAAGVSFFTKQISNERDPKGGRPEFWPGGPWPREFPRRSL